MTQCFKPTDANGAFRSNRLIHVTKDIDYLMGVGLYMYFCFLSQEVVSLLELSEAYFTSATSCPTGIFKLCDAAKTATYFAYTAIHHQLRFRSACVLNVWGERWIQTRSDNFYNFFFQPSFLKFDIYPFKYFSICRIQRRYREKCTAECSNVGLNGSDVLSWAGLTLACTTK